jgi:hypothetical protein
VSKKQGKQRPRPPHHPKHRRKLRFLSNGAILEFGFDYQARCRYARIWRSDGVEAVILHDFEHTLRKFMKDVRWKIACVENQDLIAIRRKLVQSAGDSREEDWDFFDGSMAAAIARRKT